MVNRRIQWKGWENVALQRYLDRGWGFVKQNYTIRGWEIDLIVKNDEKIVFIEVKIINWIEDMHDYITRGKMWYVQRTVNRYLLKYPTDKEIQIDAVFVQHWKVLEVFENVTMG